jgi:hypothetical protein
MKILRSILAGALVGSVSGAAISSCPAQSGCLDITVEPATDADVAACNGECLWYICINVDSSKTGCDKGGDTISHGCNGGETAPRSSCPSNEIELFSDSAKVEDQTSWSYCQFVKPADFAHFLVKDGDTCTGHDEYYFGEVFDGENYGAVAQCSPSSDGEVSLGDGIETFKTWPTTGCSGNAEGAECVWTIRAPIDDPCSVSSGGDPATPASEAPTWTPLPKDDTVKCVDSSSSGITQRLGETGLPLPAGAVEIVSSTADHVEFKITQLWKDSSVSWIQPVYKDGDNDHFCNKEETVPPHSTRILTATCVDGVAEVDLYLHDGSFKTQYSENKRGCPGWGNNNGIAHYNLLFSCAGNVDDCTPPVPPTTPPPTHAPVPVPPTGTADQPDPTAAPVPPVPAPINYAPTKEPGTAGKFPWLGFIMFFPL